MLSRRPIVVRCIGANTTEVSGPGVYDALNQIGIPFMRPARRGNGNVWHISAARTEDFLAWCDHTRRLVEVTL